MERWTRIGAAGLVAGLVAWAFAARYELLAASPYPVGIDGYWYPIQLRALLDSGRLYYPSAPLTLWWMAPFAAATNPIVGAKLGAALGTALIAVPMYVVGRRVGGGRAAGLLAAVLAATSAESAYMASEFAKNGVAVTVAVGAIATVLWCLDAPSRRRIGAAVAMVAAAALAHKTAVALAVAASIVPVAVATGRPVAVAAFAALVGAVLVVSGDVDVFTGVVAASPDWSLPALSVDQGALYFGREVAIAGGLAVAALAALRFPTDDAPLLRDRAAAIGPAVLALVAAVPWLDAGDPQGLVFRVRLLSFVPLAMCGAVVAGAVARRAMPAWRAVVPDAPGRAAAIAIAGFAAGLAMARSSVTGEGLVRAHPAMLAAVQPIADAVPEDAVVIVPERHILYMITWYTERPARLRPEPVPAARRWRVIPLNLMDGPVQDALDAARVQPVPGRPPQALHAGHRNGLVLVQESTWQWVLEQLPARSRARWEAWHTI